MKKILFALLIFIISIDIVHASSIDSVDMNIVLDEYGTATITETWKAYVTQGTEGWHPYYNLGKSNLSVVSAEMDGKSYEVVSYWNESSSLSEKAYKTGLYRVDSNETDVVFGISEYGSHTYKIVYKITNFVSNISDADMIYWQLFPYDFSMEPGNVTIKISGYYDYPDTLDVWGYGMYGAPCYVENGAIYMTSDGRISSDQYLTILVKFPKDTFKTTSHLIDNFDYYHDLAEEDSTRYVDESSSSSTESTIAAVIAGILNVCLFMIAPILVFRSVNKSMVNYDFGEAGKKLPKDVNNFRDIPCDKDVYRAFWVADTYGLNKSRNDFLGVLLLKWIQEGKVSIKTIEKKKMLKTKTESVIVFHEPTIDANMHEKKLYEYMREASIDGELENGEFKKWCEKHYSKILGWPDKVIKYEESELISEGKIEKVPYERGLIFKYTCYKHKINPSMKEEAIQMKGLKNFLVEFSQIKEKQPIEVKLWNEYLMYAQIFGIAEKVMEQFKKLYPEIMSEMEMNNFDYNTFIFVNTVSRSGMQSASHARSAAQSYSSGGGGFSSGGGGGGSFGGGGGGGGFR